MTKELNELAQQIAVARFQESEAKKAIAKLMPRYYALLDKIYGAGPVSFVHPDGHTYGRVIANKSSVDFERMLADHPEFFGEFIEPNPGVRLNEDALQEYLAEHPEQQPVIQEYISVNQESRWRKPTVAKTGEE